MGTIESEYDDAMFAFSTGDHDTAIAGLQSILERHPDSFEAQLALGMAYCRKGDYARAIAEGHKAERMRPNEQLVHTNLSLFYVKAGDKAAAEHHGLRARVAAWKDDMTPPSGKAGGAEGEQSGLSMAAPKPRNVKLPTRIPDMPWKRKPKAPDG
jgi:tetratricopeptide (TPR) repeat protein